MALTLLLCAWASQLNAAGLPTSTSPTPWSRILASVGWGGNSGLGPRFAVIDPTAGATTTEDWRQFVRDGGFLILEGASAVAEQFGFQATGKSLRVASVEDLRYPELRIIWEKPEELQQFNIPEKARVFARERWEKVPLAAGYRSGKGGVLWTATSPGGRGYEKFPYLPQAITDLEVRPALASRRLWAFFDTSYRMRVDLEYFAKRWRKSGIAALHVAAWHYYEPDESRDHYLKNLIEACHRNGILVYAWIELPHVSEKFWEQHPEWREKTAILQDAHLDWRKLMNLQNRDCFRAVSQGIEELIGRFDWDGVNLAELYFESLESYLNPSRFTPMNDEVRREFQELQGFDPLVIFDRNSPLHYDKTINGIRPFLDFRAGLAKRMQEEWIAEMERIRAKRRHLDLVLTHVDDRFDNQMRDAIGADAARLLPLLETHDFRFLIEDPATIWDLGPERYTELARRYEPLTPHAHQLAIDINIVERYQDVYPTKQQTGAEFFQLVHLASQAFPRVALYFESSILKPDLPLLAAAAAVVSEARREGETLVVDSPQGVGVAWESPALVNGKPWPAKEAGIVWLPAGKHTIAPSSAEPYLRLIDLNASLKSAGVHTYGLEFEYDSQARAIALFNRQPAKVLVDGAELQTGWHQGDAAVSLMLPPGRHKVSVVAR